MDKPLVVHFARQSNTQEFREQGGERLVNVHAETIAKDKYRLRMSPGLTTFSTGASDFGVRGGIKSGDNIYVVFQTAVVKITSAGARTTVGHISGTGPVSMALNAASSPQIGIVNEAGSYYILESDVLTHINTTDIGLFNSICWIEGYFVLTLEDGRFFNTALNDGTSISGLDYATAEGAPDGLMGGFAHGSELWLFGEDTIEVWANAANATGSPFSRQGGSWINKGCKSFFSVVQADNTLFWVGNDGLVYRNRSYTPQRISTEAVERAIAGASDPGSIRGGTYTIHGHAFYVISDDNFTWVYDIKEGLWHERKSKALNRWRAEVFINAFDTWLVGTVDDGNLYEIDMDSRLEGTNEIVWQGDSVDMGSSPERATISCVEIDFVTGRASISGTVPQTAPFLELSYSDDGGATYSMPRQLPLGGIGEYNMRVREWKLGRTGAKWGRRWRIVGSVPHIVTMTKFVVHVEPLAA